MDLLKELLNESSLSRLWDKSQNYDFGIITAFRYARECGTGEPYTTKENLQRNSILLNKLRGRGYSVTSIKGSFIENYGDPENEIEVAENSFFVADEQNKGTLKSDLIRFGQEFEQDSIIFGEKGQDSVLIGTNDCEGAPLRGGGIDRLGGTVFGQDGQFMSRVNGRPFIFNESAELLEYGVLKYPSELRAVIRKGKQPII